MSSCTENNLYDASSDEFVEVTFTVTSEGVLATRGIPEGGTVYYPGQGEYPQISDGSKAKRLIWAVYDKEGNLLPELGNGYESTTPAKDAVAGFGQVAEDVTEFPHKITIRLVRGQEYSFAFWAQDENCTAFDTQDLRSVKIDYKGTNNNLANDELRDAFCKVETFTVTSAPSMERTIILRRPFAQVNVGIPQSEYEALRQSGVRIVKSKIHMENVATEFDVVANSTHGENPELRQAIDFEENFIPAYYNYNVEEDGIPTDEQLSQGREGSRPQTQDLKIDLNHDGTIEAYGEKNGEEMDARDETYNYMLMAYILPADRNDGTSTYSTTLDHVEFSLIPEKEGQTPLTFSLDNVPVQRNWRTNIFGEMFTSDVVLRIDLDPFYAGDYNYPEWERIYEGVTYNAMDGAIHISNGAGLVWLAKATNGDWADEKAFEEDNTHNPKGANLTNSAKLMLKAAGETAWPQHGLFRFTGIDIKLDADIDMNVYAQLFNNGENEFTPIGFADEICINHVLGRENYYFEADGHPLRFFNGNFDGQNHTIYNLKTLRPESLEDTRAYGLFGTVGRTGYIKNLRLKNVDVESHWHAGAIVGYVYGPVQGGNYVNDAEAYNNLGYVIENCYVDGGKIISTSRRSKTTEPEEYDDANNIGGIAGLLYNRCTVQNCNVRNLTLRGYRKVSGIAGQSGGDYRDGTAVINNYVYDVTIIADQYQEYGKGNDTNKAYDIEDEFVGAPNGARVEGNKGSGNTLYVFAHPIVDGIPTTTIGVSSTNGLLSNPPLDVFPRLARYAQVVNINTSILGGPSAYKKYTGDDSRMKGIADETSGRVGLWVSGLTVNGDGDANPATLDNATITASGVEEDNACVLFIKDEATIKNLTVHGATYAGQGICLSPASGKTITLTSVLSYDAKQVLTDESNGNDGNLVAEGCNFRGYVKLSAGYKAVTFTNTIFDGSTKRADETTNKLESASKVTLDGCTFIAPFEINVAEGSEFKNCEGIVIQDGKTVKVPITANCTISNE